MISDEDAARLVERLRAAARAAGPTPDAVVERARAAWALRGVDAELAELVSDSLERAGAVRGPDERVRLLSFEAGGVLIDLQLERSGSVLAVRGVVSGAAGPVEVETPDGRHPATPDDGGWFVVEGVRAGPVRVRAGRVVTPWVTG